MNTKRTLVSFLLIASVLLLTSMVSAHTATGLGNYVEIDGDTVLDESSVGITATYDASTLVAGDELTVKVRFTAEDSDSIKVKATLEGEEDEVEVETSKFYVVSGNNYTKTLTLKVPSDFDEDLITGDFELTLEVGDDEVAIITLSDVQRTAYEASITSDVESTVEAGQTLQVEFEVENTGYNDLEDAYAIVSIAELGVSKKVSLEDLLNIENDELDKDDANYDEDSYNSIKGTVNLAVPADAKAGKYTLEITVSNDDEDFTNTATKEITIENSVSSLVLKSGNDLVLLNPTNQLKVYTVKYESTEAVVVMPAASSKTVAIEVPTSGDYKFDVAVMSGATILGTVAFEGTSESAQMTSPVFVLTVILAIVFLVLLVVLVVLITKKPQKTEEFGESYY